MREFTSWDCLPKSHRKIEERSTFVGDVTVRTASNKSNVLHVSFHLELVCFLVNNSAIPILAGATGSLRIIKITIYADKTRGDFPDASPNRSCNRIIIFTDIFIIFRRKLLYSFFYCVNWRVNISRDFSRLIYFPFSVNFNREQLSVNSAFLARFVAELHFRSNNISHLVCGWQTFHELTRRLQVTKEAEPRTLLP